MSIKVGINGFGRIGRNVFRYALESGADIEFVAVNDLTDTKTLAHLLKWDSVLGPFEKDVKVEGDYIVAGGQKVKVTAERDISNLKWDGVDVVIEATGLFRDGKQCQKHIDNGAKKVIISAPGKNEDKTLVLGVNGEEYDKDKHHIVSNASCTTNCLAPVSKVLMQFGIIQGLMTTIHAYTGDQKVLDAPHKDLRRARACAVSMIPTTTGAAKAVALVIPELKGKFTGLAVRVPTPNVSLVDLTVQLEQKVSKEDINAAMKKAAEGELKGILQYLDEPLVSIDLRKNSNSSIFDAEQTYVVDQGDGKGDFVKILSWYDNEWGYSCRCVDLALMMMK